MCDSRASIIAYCCSVLSEIYFCSQEYSDSKSWKLNTSGPQSLENKHFVVVIVCLFSCEVYICNCAQTSGLHYMYKNVVALCLSMY